MKLCVRCLSIKDLTYFGKLKSSNDGHRNVCKACRIIEAEKSRDRKKEYDKKYYNENKEIMSKKMKYYYSKNAAKYIEMSKMRYTENKEIISLKSKLYVLKNKEKTTEYQKKYKQENKGKRKLYNAKNKEKLNKARREYERKRSARDDSFVICAFLRSGFRKTLSYKSGWRHFFKLSGYSRDDYIFHFLNNYKTEFALYKKRTGEYHIDHIIPCASYDFTLIDNIKSCWNPRNLRIIPATENMKKKDTLDIELIKQYGILDLMPKGMKH